MQFEKLIWEALIKLLEKEKGKTARRGPQPGEPAQRGRPLARAGDFSKEPLTLQQINPPSYLLFLFSL